MSEKEVEAVDMKPIKNGFDMLCRVIFYSMCLSLFAGFSLIGVLGFITICEVVKTL